MLQIKDGVCFSYLFLKGWTGIDYSGEERDPLALLSLSADIPKPLCSGVRM